MILDFIIDVFCGIIDALTFNRSSGKRRKKR